MTGTAARTIQAVAVLAAMGLAAQPALACAFHTELPAETLADRLLGSDQLLLARPDPANPVSFKVVGALRGPAVDLDLPVLVDVATRRRLAADPEATVIFARFDPYGPLERLALMDAQMRPVVAEILARSEDWIFNGDGPRARYFAALLDHPDDTIHRLALRELDRLPYGILRSTLRPSDPARLRAGLYDPGNLSLLPIRALLLGLSDTPASRAEIAQAIEAGSAAVGARTLGAFAVAYVEQRGEPGVQVLVDRYIAAPGAAPDARALVIEALAIHRAEGASELAGVIDAVLAAALAARPAAAGDVARLFAMRADFSQAAAVARARRQAGLTTAADAIAIASYLAMADAAGSAAAAPSTPETLQ